MKIAICFSGQWRTGIEASPNILRYLGDILPHCDFFIHTWDYNQQKNYFNTKIFGRGYNLVEKTIDEIIKIYNPKALHIDNLEIIKNKEKCIFSDGFESNYIDLVHPWLYSFMKSVEYKQTYENTNGFEYDYVIKLRPDIIFSERRTLDTELNIIKPSVCSDFYIENLWNTKWNIDTLWCDDVYYISKSKTMNVAASFYDYKKNEIKRFYPKNGIGTNGFIRFLLTNGITIKSVADRIGGYGIYREECNMYSPVFQTAQCIFCDDYYYSGHSGYNLDFEYDSIYDYLNMNYVIDSTKSYYIDELQTKYK